MNSSSIAYNLLASKFFMSHEAMEVEGTKKITSLKLSPMLIYNDEKLSNFVAVESNQFKRGVLKFIQLQLKVINLSWILNNL